MLRTLKRSIISNPAQFPEQVYADVLLKSSAEIVHLEYTPSKLPPKPSEEWTRFVCISDTHSHTFEVPAGDVLLHSGDLTNIGTVKDFEKTMDWLCSLPHKIKIIIAGNHDLTLDTQFYEREHARMHGNRGLGKQKLEPILKILHGSRAKKSGIVYLQDQEYKFQTKKDGRFWSVYGSPWSLEFCHWAFAYNPEDAEELVSNFPKTDILLTHGPPLEIFDEVLSGFKAGCEALRARLPELRPRMHLFGHIHEAHGAHIHTWDPAFDNVPPTIQNSDSSMSIAARPVSTEESRPGEAELEKTVFINAASWPMGRNAFRRDGVRPPFGGPGFQPVVVDLKD